MALISLACTPDWQPGAQRRGGVRPQANGSRSEPRPAAGPPATAGKWRGSWATTATGTSCGDRAERPWAPGRVLGSREPLAPSLGDKGRQRKQRAVAVTRPPPLLIGGERARLGEVKCQWWRGSWQSGPDGAGGRSVSCGVRRPGFHPGPPTNQLNDLGLVIPPVALLVLPQKARRLLSLSFLICTMGITTLGLC